MDTNILNAAVIGCGNISPMHIEAISKSDKSKLYAVADINREKTDSVSKKYGCKAFYDYRELLDDNNIDVVHICTPHYLHGEMIIEALRKGKHVLTEKPLCISKKEADSILEAVNLSDRLVGVCFQNRYKNTSKKFKEFIDEGKGGRILGGKGIVTWYRDKDYYAQSGWRGKWATEGGGVLINQAIHTIDLLRWFVGEVEKVDGNVTTRLLNEHIEVENTAEGIISFKNGVNCLLYATSTYCTDSTVEIEIVCENAKLNMTDKLVITYNDGTVEEYCDIDVDTGYKLCWGDYHSRLIEDFYDCILSRRNFSVDVVEGIKTLQIVLDFYKNIERK